MQFGNLSGLVNGTETIVFDYEVTGSAVASVSTGNILNGNEDGWYTIIFRLINAAGNIDVGVYFNADETGANYGCRGITGESTAAPVDRKFVDTIATIASAGVTSGTTGFSVHRLYAKSGAVRMLTGVIAGYIATTTVTRINPTAGVWNNTSDNITSMKFYAAGTSLGVGTRIIILKTNNFTDGTPSGTSTTPYLKGSWKRIESWVATGGETSVTFSPLNGDGEVVYRLRGALTNASGTSSSNTRVRFNADAGTNYGYQAITSTLTTKASVRSTYTGILLEYNETLSGHSAHHDMWLFGKSGFLRTAIVNSATNIDGTSVDQTSTWGWSWNNTADNLTSMVIAQNGDHTWAAGTQFELYVLKPNG